MLLPALAKARAKARAISCINNLKTDSLAMQIYSDDYNGMIGVYCYHGLAYKDQYTWVGMLYYHKYLPDESGCARCPVFGNKMVLNTIYSKSCYGAINTKVVFDTNRQSQVFYAEAAAYNRYIDTKQVAAPTSFPLLMDTVETTAPVSDFYVFDPAPTSTYGASARHGGQINVAFLGGNANAMRPGNLKETGKDVGLFVTAGNYKYFGEDNTLIAW